MLCCGRVSSTADQQTRIHFVLTSCVRVCYYGDMTNQTNQLSSAGIAVRRGKRLARQSERDELRAVSLLRVEGCAPACLTCAMGIHDVESGECPCCGEVVE